MSGEVLLEAFLPLAVLVGLIVFALFVGVAFSAESDAREARRRPRRSMRQRAAARRVRFR